MNISWNRDFRPEPLLSEIERIRVDVDGQVAFKGGQFGVAIAVLRSALIVPDSIPELDVSLSIRKGVTAAVKAGPLTPDGVLNRIKNQLLERRRKRPKPLVIVGTLSIPNDVPIRRRSLFDSQVVFLRSVDSKFRKSREKSEIALSHMPEVSEGCVNLQATVYAKDANSAVHAVYRSVDTIRSFWNFAENHGRSTFSFGKPKPDPINKVRWIGATTVHEIGGKLAYDGYWADTDNMTCERPFKTRDFDHWINIERTFRGRLLSAPEIKTVTDYLVAYVRALDSHDYEKSYLALWSLLEKMMGGIEHGNYKRVLARLMRVFHFKDQHTHDFYRQEVLHLKQYRHRIVHDSKSTEDLEIVTHQLRSFVENLIRFILWNISKFGSLSQIRAFLDLPVDVGELEQHQEIVRTAIRYRRRS